MKFNNLFVCEIDSFSKSSSFAQISKHTHTHTQNINLCALRATNDAHFNLHVFGIYRYIYIEIYLVQYNNALRYMHTHTHIAPDGISPLIISIANAIYMCGL